MASEWLFVEALGLSRAPGASDASTYQVFVRDLVLRCRVGIYDFEKSIRQRVRINVELDVLDRGPFDDDFRKVLNYESIVHGINAIADSGHVELVETLAERIARFCTADRRVGRARVRVEKLDVYPEAESVGVTIERRRDPPVEAFR